MIGIGEWETGVQASQSLGFSTVGNMTDHVFRFRILPASTSNLFPNC